VNQYTVIIAAGIGVIVLVVAIFGADIVKLSVPTQEYKTSCTITKKT